jgi:predicted Zn finger-like uncharacterized protein
MAKATNVQVECPACAADIAIDDVPLRGSIVGLVLKCQNCGQVFHFRLDQDLSKATVRGADVLGHYDDTLGNRLQLCNDTA